VLLVGHGTADAQGRSQLLELAEKVRTLAGSTPVEPAFLELADPTIARAARRLADAGIRRIVVAPVLLFSAGHAQRDLPRAVAEALRPYPQVKWRQSQHLGCHPAVLEVSARRMRQAQAPLDIVPPSQTGLIQAGRGSRDAQATAEMNRFTQLRVESTPVGRYATGFLAMARPSLGEVLAAAARWDCRRIVVQPHLLFSGQLARNVARAVAQIATEHPEKEWVLAEPLGASWHLAQAIIGRVGEGAPIYETERWVGNFSTR